LEFQENHQDPNGGNESSRKELNLFFLAKHLKIIKQHHLIILNQIGLNSFSYFISQSNPQTLFTTPFINHFFGALWGTPFPN